LVAHRIRRAVPTDKRVTLRVIDAPEVQAYLLMAGALTVGMLTGGEAPGPDPATGAWLQPRGRCGTPTALPGLRGRQREPRRV